MYDLALQGDMHEAAAINEQIWELMALEDDIGKYVQIPKAALTLMGRPSGSPRGPRLPLTAPEQERLASICQQLGLVSAGPRQP
jgi:dihydrodipicolinate synthase/N-acetylneuraminate lyase